MARDKKRLIALDVGEKRIGVAVSDPLGLTAQGVETIFTKGRKRDLARVKEIAKTYDTDCVLLGLPRNMDGSEGFQAEYVREFARGLEAEGFKIIYQDERMTSLMAGRVLREGGVRGDRRKEIIDKMAAGYILQAFLDSGKGWEEE